MTNNDSTADAVGLVKEYMQALQIGDKDTILRLYADDAEIIPENLPSLRGRDAPTGFAPVLPSPGSFRARAKGVTIGTCIW